MTGSDQLDLFAARQLRDEGRDLVSANAGDWFDQALAYVANLSSWRGTGEDLRLEITDVLGEPHHRNAWGALVAQAVSRRLLVATGERVPMRTPKSHARQTDMYRSQKRGE